MKLQKRNIYWLLVITIIYILLVGLFLYTVINKSNSTDSLKQRLLDKNNIEYSVNSIFKVSNDYLNNNQTNTIVFQDKDLIIKEDFYFKYIYNKDASFILNTGGYNENSNYLFVLVKRYIIESNTTFNLNDTLDYLATGENEHTNKILSISFSKVNFNENLTDKSFFDESIFITDYSLLDLNSPKIYSNNSLFHQNSEDDTGTITGERRILSKAKLSQRKADFCCSKETAEKRQLNSSSSFEDSSNNSTLDSINNSTFLIRNKSTDGSSLDKVNNNPSNEDSNEKSKNNYSYLFNKKFRFTILEKYSLNFFNEESLEQIGIISFSTDNNVELNLSEYIQNALTNEISNLPHPVSSNGAINNNLIQTTIYTSTNIFIEVNNIKYAYYGYINTFNYYFIIIAATGVSAFTYLFYLLYEYVNNYCLAYHQHINEDNAIHINNTTENCNNNACQTHKRRLETYARFNSNFNEDFYEINNLFSFFSHEKNKSQDSKNDVFNVKKSNLLNYDDNYFAVNDPKKDNNNREPNIKLISNAVANNQNNNHFNNINSRNLYNPILSSSIELTSLGAKKNDLKNTNSYEFSKNKLKSKNSGKVNNNNHHHHYSTNSNVKSTSKHNNSNSNSNSNSNNSNQQNNIQKFDTNPLLIFRLFENFKHIFNENDQTSKPDGNYIIPKDNPKETIPKENTDDMVIKEDNKDSPSSTSFYSPNFQYLISKVKCLFEGINKAESPKEISFSEENNNDYDIKLKEEKKNNEIMSFGNANNSNHGKCNESKADSLIQDPKDLSLTDNTSKNFNSNITNNPAETPESVFKIKQASSLLETFVYNQKPADKDLIADKTDQEFSKNYCSYYPQVIRSITLCNNNADDDIIIRPENDNNKETSEYKTNKKLEVNQETRIYHEEDDLCELNKINLSIRNYVYPSSLENNNDSESILKDSSEVNYQHNKQLEKGAEPAKGRIENISTSITEVISKKENDNNSDNFEKTLQASVNYNNNYQVFNKQQETSNNITVMRVPSSIDVLGELTNTNNTNSNLPPIYLEIPNDKGTKTLDAQTDSYTNNNYIPPQTNQNSKNESSKNFSFNNNTQQPVALEIISRNDDNLESNNNNNKNDNDNAIIIEKIKNTFIKNNFSGSNYLEVTYDMIDNNNSSSFNNMNALNNIIQNNNSIYFNNAEATKANNSTINNINNNNNNTLINIIEVKDLAIEAKTNFKDNKGVVDIKEALGDNINNGNLIEIDGKKEAISKLEVIFTTNNNNIIKDNIKDNNKVIKEELMPINNYWNNNHEDYYKLDKINRIVDDENKQLKAQSTGVLEDANTIGNENNLDLIKSGRNCTLVNKNKEEDNANTNIQEGKCTILSNRKTKVKSKFKSELEKYFQINNTKDNGKKNSLDSKTTKSPPKQGINKNFAASNNSSINKHTLLITNSSQSSQEKREIKEVDSVKSSLKSSSAKSSVKTSKFGVIKEDRDKAEINNNTTNNNNDNDNNNNNHNNYEVKTQIDNYSKQVPDEIKNSSNTEFENLDDYNSKLKSALNENFINNSNQTEVLHFFKKIIENSSNNRFKSERYSLMFLIEKLFIQQSIIQNILFTQDQLNIINLLSGNMTITSSSQLESIIESLEHILVDFRSDIDDNNDNSNKDKQKHFEQRVGQPQNQPPNNIKAINKELLFITKSLFETFLNKYSLELHN